MIIDSCRHDELAATIAPLLADWNDTVVPRQVEILPNCSYAPAYAWMYSYEKQMKYRIEKAIRRPLARFERFLFGPDSAISEGLSNAFVHGHRRDPDLPITVHCSVGQRGLALTITDSGKGFDVSKTVQRANRGSTYYSYAGNGMKTLAEQSGVTASFADGGRSLHLAIEWPSP